MAMVSMKEAAVMAGIGRTTLYRKADRGLLSTIKMPDGSRKVDTSELYRVFPPDNHEIVKAVHEGQGVDSLKKEIEYLKSIIIAKDQVIEVQAAALRMLEHKPATVPPTDVEPVASVASQEPVVIPNTITTVPAEVPAPKRSFWARIMGRG